MAQKGEDTGLDQAFVDDLAGIVEGSRAARPQNGSELFDLPQYKFGLHEKPPVDRESLGRFSTDLANLFGAQETDFGTKVAVGAAGGLSSLAKAPSTALKVLNTLGVSQETIDRQIPNIQRAAKWLEGRGQELDALSHEAEDPRFADQGFLAQAARGLGSAALFAAQAGAGGKVAQSVLTVLSGGAQTAVPMYEDILAETGDPKKAMQGALLGFGIGASEVFGIGGNLGKLDELVGGGLYKAFVRMAVEGTEEAAQEFVQQIGEGVSRGVMTDKEINALQLAAESGRAGALGFFIGAGIQAGKHTLQTVLQPGTGMEGTVPGSQGELTHEDAAAIGVQKSLQTGLEPGGGPRFTSTPGATPIPSDLSVAARSEAGKSVSEVKSKPKGEAVAAQEARAPEEVASSILGGEPVAREEITPDVIKAVVELHGRPQEEQITPPAQPTPGEAEQSASKKEAVREPAGSAAGGVSSEDPLVYAHTKEPAKNFPPPGEGSVWGPVKAVRIDSIEETQSKNFRASIDEDRVESFMRAMSEGKPIPPVTGMNTPDGTIRLLDGHHRLEAARRLGFEDLPIRMLEAERRKHKLTLTEKDLAAEEQLKGVVEIGGDAAAIAKKGELDAKFPVMNLRGDKRISRRVVQIAKRREGARAVRIFADLADLTSLNNLFSHDFADEVIDAYIEEWKKISRGGDAKIAKIAGDEFAATIIVGKNDNPDVIVARIEESAKAALRRFGLGEGVSGRQFGVDAGWADIDLGEEDASVAIKRATDEADLMSKARKQKRNPSKSKLTAEQYEQLAPKAQAEREERLKSQAETELAGRAAQIPGGAFGDTTEEVVGGSRAERPGQTAQEQASAALSSAVEELWADRPNAPEVAQPTQMKRVRFKTQMLSGEKSVTGTLYELPGYKGPQLAVVKSSKTITAYLPKSGTAIHYGAVQGGDVVGGMDGFFRTVVQRIDQARRANPKPAAEPDERGPARADQERGVREIRRELKKSSPAPAEQAAPESTQPFTPDTIQETFGVPEPQAQAISALAAAMGLDTKKVRLVKGGTPGKGALRQAAPGEWYFSNVADAVGKWQPKGTREQLLAHLGKTKGAKEEMEWIGLREWLNNKPKVTRDEVRAFVEQNRVDVREVTRGAPTRTELSVSEARDKPERDARQAFYDALDVLGRKLGASGIIDYETFPLQDNSHSFMANETHQGFYYRKARDAGLQHELDVLQTASDAWKAAQKAKYETDAKPRRKAMFADYQTPGGEDYRELLLTLRGNAPVGEQTQFVGGHFEEGNILAHVRFNDRTDAQGRKVLFLEEVQSDWHQAGKRKGYKKSKYGFRIREHAGVRGGWEVVSDEGVLRSRSDTRDAAEESLRQIVWQLVTTPFTRDQEGMVIDAPFKGTGWPRLAMKRMLSYAAEHGYDGIAWTTGAMQAERYNLSKQVRSISWTHGFTNDLPTTGVNIVTTDGSRIQFNVSDGKVVSGANSQLVGKPLEDVIGKDVAKKILESQNGQLAGEGLNIGGEGMRAFYDRELVNVANELGKKLGTRVEQTSTGIDRVESHSNLTVTEEVSVPFLPLDSSTRERIKEQGFPLFQGDKGAVEFTDGGQAIIRALESPDVSTGVHELAHVARRFLLDRSIPAENRLGITEEQISHAETWSGAVDGKWTTEAEEKFARGFERYLRDGKAPTLGLRKLFAQFKAWLHDIYKKLAGSPIRLKITPEMRTVYDSLVTRAEQREARGRDEATGIALTPQMSKEGSSVRMTIGGSVGKIEIRGEVRPFHMGIETAVTPRIVGQLTTVNRADSGGKDMPLAAKRKVLAAVQAKLEELFKQFKSTTTDDPSATKETEQAAPEAKVEPVRKETLKSPPPSTTIPDQFYAFPGELLPDIKNAIDTLSARLNRSHNQQAFTAAVIPTESFTDHKIRKIQDSWIGVKRLQQEILERGGSVTDETDAYENEELRKGKTKERLKRFVDGHFQPILAALRTDGISQEEFGTALVARHAPERNAVIRGRDEANSAGSGMADEEAADIMAKVRSGKRADGFQRAFDRFDAMMRDIRVGWVIDGLMSQEDVNALEKQYQFYAPLRSDLDELGKLSPFRGTGRGLDVRGKEFKSAIGRHTMVDASKVLAYAQTQAELGIIRGEKNKVNQAFINLLRANPELTKDFAKINPSQTKRALVNGVVKSTMDPRFQAADNVILVHENGEHVWIEFSKRYQNVADAFKNKGAENLGSLVRYVGGFTRTLAGLSTRYNPVFPAFNLIRDAAAVFINSHEHGVLFAMRTVRDIPRAMKALSGFESGMWSTYADEYNAVGAPVSFLDLSNFEDKLKQIERMAKRESKVGAAGQLVRGWGAMASAMESAVDIGENAVRLSAYVHAREDLGMSPQKAASWSKNITTNFERRGEYGAALNALYMFSNAGIQSTSRIAQALKNPGVRRLLASAFAGLMAWDQIMRAIGGADADGTPCWDKIPQYIKRHNFVFQYPAGKGGCGRMVTIPAPFTYDLIQTMAFQLSGAMSGHIKPWDAISEASSAAVEAFDPIGSGQIELGDPASYGETLSPTISDPLVELIANRDWKGDAIGPEDYGGHKPDSERYWPSASKPAVSVAKWLNSATGGSKIDPGFIDVSPHTLDHWVKFLTGGIGRTLIQAYDTTTKYNAGEPIAPRDVPFVSRLLRDPSPFASTSDFHDLQDGILREKDRAKLGKTTMPDDLYAIWKEGNKLEVYRRNRRNEIDAMTAEDRQRATIELDRTIQQWNKRAREALLQETKK